MMHVASAGVRATVQDRGRLGHLRFGVPPSGPADPYAAAAANALVGNDADAALVEVIGLPFTFSCDDARVVAVTGREVSLLRRDRLPGWTSAFVRAGEAVTVVGGTGTRFAYLAVAGGIATPAVLGSRATYLPAGIGAALSAGDTLALGPARAWSDRAARYLAGPTYDGVVRALAGPHVWRFDDEEIGAFFESPFEVDPASDRMGTRLRGPALRPRGDELLSCGVVAGAVQVPQGGAPIVLLADHQTTGGYPVIATVIGPDLGKVAQAGAGETLRFYRVERDGLLDELRAARRALEAVRAVA